MVALKSLEHTAPELRVHFRDLYRRLHGGAFAFPESDFADDPGEEAATTVIAVGEAVPGVLDYIFDFDYFRFQAEVDRNYQLNVEHLSLCASDVILFAADGVTQEEGNWKSRERVSSGPQILWTAPGSGVHYLAVRNFGGKSGAYTLTVTPIAAVADDHGDSAAAAMDISAGEVIAGDVDNHFDLDYYRFQAADGQAFHIEVTNGRLESFRVALYLSNGVTPAKMERDDIAAVESRGGQWFDIQDLRNLVWGDRSFLFEWVAPSSGSFNLVVEGANESVGAYAVGVK